MERSDFLLDLIEKNNIPGCIILITEDGNELRISDAKNNIHELNITKALAMIILSQQEGKDTNWARIIRNAADTIVATCAMIEDLTEED